MGRAQSPALNDGKQPFAFCGRPTASIPWETIPNLNNPDDYVVVNTWTSAEHWKKWCQSKQRKEIEESIEALLGEKTQWQIDWYG